MTLIVTQITVAQAATTVNIFITIMSFTIALFLIVHLVKFLPITTTATAWSSISRTLHSSLWPTILRADSRSGQAEGVVVSTLTRLGTVTAILVAVAGVILPLGLSEGPVVHGDFRFVKGVYVLDDSPLALSTNPNQDSFIYGRVCDGFLPHCPGNVDPNTTTIAPSIVEIFNSTPHGPFTMKFRRFYYGDETYNCSIGFVASAETFFLRNTTFFADGLLIDMTTESPGIGLWNQTLPTEIQMGGTWSQDILWIEPETECVNTNLTVDYFLMNGPDLPPDEFNITDHGGFYDLTHEPPSYNLDGQNINLRDHAYVGAVYSNAFAMQFFNATRNSSSEGFSYPLSYNFSTSLHPSDLMKIGALPLSYLNITRESTTDILCEGFGVDDNANITNVHVSCGIFLGPALRTDGGDPRMFDVGSKWAQSFHACSSATRVSVQTVTFSSNSGTDIRGLEFDRERNGLNVLWATEKTDLKIGDIDLFWGRVDDRYENDPSLWTTRSNRFYLPAGLTSTFTFPVLAAGMPAAAHTQAWGTVYEPIIGRDEDSQDYSGEYDYAIRIKLQNLVELDPLRGNAQTRNLIFTDIMANNIIGTQTNDTLLVADHLRTISYDFKYAIPGFILLAIWTPTFLSAVLFLLTQTVTFQYMKKVFNHTSVGRVVVGTSALRVQPQGGDTPYMPVSHHYSDVNLGGLSGHHYDESGWADTIGKTLVTLNIKNPPRNVTEENISLMETHSHYM